VFAAGAGLAESGLGDERSGTSAGTFLKIPIDPRGVAMGGGLAADASGLTSTCWNPAGLAILNDPEVMVVHFRWPGEIDYEYVALGDYSRRLGGAVALQFAYMGSTLDETTEEFPSGTGRNFGVRNWFLAATYARPFTDRLSFGITGRLVRESLGTEVGGPSMTNALLDVGTLYEIDFMRTRLGFSLLYFGPEFQPSGSYLSHATGETTKYKEFAPPTTFKLAVGNRLLQHEPFELRAHFEMNHFADAGETVKFGGELSVHDQFFLRSGYDAGADAMRFSAGVGMAARFGSRLGQADYAFTDGEVLGEVHRIAIRLVL
jgi:hypothetical protein